MLLRNRSCSRNLQKRSDGRPTLLQVDMQGSGQLPVTPERAESVPQEEQVAGAHGVMRGGEEASGQIPRNSKDVGRTRNLISV